jgi:hypothetical protein
MKTLLRLGLLVFVCGGWALAAASLHVVRLTDDNYWIGIIPKSRLGFADTYVDVRNWSDADVVGHVDFVRRVTEAGKEKWLTHVAPAGGPSIIDHLLNLFKDSANPADSAENATESSGESAPASEKTPEKKPVAPIYKGVR